ncbi:heterokaryon incompatibility protein-domain-containing protein [Annulohypoxylon moriforme]|nr:heterokaryon incompatibility protein-domain-containing protein [Annulohypoxylon moriforme]
MRLLNARTFEVREFSDDESQTYAILSHTWGDEECSFQQMSAPDVSTRKGYTKIKYCCQQAIKEGLEWVWVDTCCIDKTSTAELSEAINSMFRWYKNAAICYAYLADVTDIHELAQSRWMTRGWTLQELIAPKDVHFYSMNWRYLGSKHDLQDELQRITGIDRLILSTGVFNEACIAKRMSWAANRKTTRIEDIAYSLLGIFEVNMPLLYGEGRRSFIRLQEEIMKISDDYSLFAWGIPLELKPMDWSTIGSWSESSQLHGLFADSPSDFATEYEIKPLSYLHSDMPPIMFSSGVRIELSTQIEGVYQYAGLPCHVKGRNKGYLGIPLFNWNGRFNARCGPLVIMPHKEWSEGYKKTLLIKAPSTLHTIPQSINIVLMRDINEDEHRLVIDEIYCPHEGVYSYDGHIIALPTDRKGCHLVLFLNTIFDCDRKRYPRKLESTSEDCQSSPPFALVLGSATEYWLALVPILREEHAHEDFHDLFDFQGSLTKHCMTKSQLKYLIENDEEDILTDGKVSQLSQRLHFHRLLYQNYFYKESLKAVLHVKLIGTSLSSAEKAMFVYLKVETVPDCTRTSPFLKLRAKGRHRRTK